MKKVVLAITLLGLFISSHAGAMNCSVPVYKSVPMYKIVVKNIPHQECWEEEKVTPRYSNHSFSQLPTHERIVATRCITTKCKTAYERVEEYVLTGYRNYAKYGCNTITKISNCPLTQINTVVNY
jgi:hypothetical protein